MTLSPTHTPQDLGTADGIISHIEGLLDGTKFLDDLEVPVSGSLSEEQFDAIENALY